MRSSCPARQLHDCLPVSNWTRERHSILQRLDCRCRERRTNPSKLAGILCAAGEASADVASGAVHEEDDRGAATSIERDTQVPSQRAREIRRD